MAPRAYQRAHDHIFEALLELDLATFQTRPQIEAALAPKIPSLNLRRFLLKNLGRMEDGRLIWKMNLRGVAENYSRLGEVLNAGQPFAGPTLFIRGGKSNYLTAKDEPEIRRLFPAAQTQTIPAAGHWVHADAPDEFLRLVLDFL
jgi:pimeloyl-ACP methyl ester carboxylesterase